MVAMSDLITRAGEGETLPMLGVIKASAHQTAGAFELLEYRGPIHPPPHVHREHDEAFFILEGSFIFTLGTDVFDISTGDLVRVPRGTRHGFSATTDSRALLLTVPAGLEGFFRELASGIAEGRSSEEIRATLAGRYDSYPAPG
jgi:mannose-6-phosphate isomerase-like protein (cupin superfamily)